MQMQHKARAVLLCTCNVTMRKRPCITHAVLVKSEDKHRPRHLALLTILCLASMSETYTPSILKMARISS